MLLSSAPDSAATVANPALKLWPQKFLLSIPALAGSSVYGIYKMFNAGDLIININSFMTIGLSFIFSYLTIKYLLIYLKNFSFNIIVGYRLILGSIILATVYL